jgi:hypothetical protein
MTTNEERKFTPLHLETRSVIDTESAAFHLNRQPQTLHLWASKNNGPITPLRINGRLAWRVADLRKLLEVE